MERECYTCRETKLIEEFCKTKKEKSGYAYQCKECKRNENMFYRYGITRNEYNLMLIKQNNSCAICEKSQLELVKFLHIDHCHKSRVVRGLLCSKCNHAIGLLGDKIKYLHRFIDYLKISNTDKS